MKRFLSIVVLIVFGLMSPAAAQTADGVAWVQIEARPDLAQAGDRARFYADLLEDVNGFALGSGWYAITLGPYTPEDAELVLQTYRRDGLIPRDSYIAQTSAYGGRFWPQDGTATSPGIARATPETPAAPEIRGEDTSAAPAAQATTPAVPDETPAQARRSEQALSAAERQSLQTALRWSGFYTGAIDGAFGRGTRASMSAWQRANGFEPTGILTTAQRGVLMDAYNAVLAGLDLRVVSDLNTGIEMKIPTARVSFSEYNPPFARFDATDGSAASVLLISQPGDRSTLASLYEVMQTLEIVPLDGPRDLRRNSFSLTGRSDRIVSETRVSLADGHVKGFTLIWPAGDEERRTRLLAEMEAGFTRLNGVLDPATGFDLQADLVAGLQIRKPRLSRSGFYLDANGTVLTTADAVQGCTRVTLDDTWDAEAGALDAERGIAIVRPKQALAPLGVATFSQSLPALQSEIAVAGYSYEGTLGAPSVTFGTLAGLQGLQGETDVSRLDVSALPGDAGGPVLDQSGKVVGMLLPGPGGSRQLPDNVRFAVTGAAISDFVTAAGLDIGVGTSTDRAAPEDITAGGADMTVLVSCWD